MSERAAHVDIPVFSDRLDEIMAAMIEGKIPNVGRFCGHCYTPVSKSAKACAHCGTSTRDYPPVEKIPSAFFDLYRRMRKRESLIVNSFAFAGLGIGLLLFILLAGLAVYRYEQSLWMLAGATAVFIVGGRIFAGLLGGWIGDSIGYDFAHRRLVNEWHDYERERDSGRSTSVQARAEAR
ncbi:MAG: zinc ribbon domain-containing protein [Dehalococcoidia bacterium]